jgi:hypothetical protein
MPGARLTCGAHDEPPGLGLQLHLDRQLRLIEHGLRHTDATRIPDSNDARFDSQVVTL